MGNYCCTIRTNYFHVKDADEFRSFMKRIYGCEDSIELWEEKDNDGNVIFGFGCYGGISGLKNAIDDEEEDCDESSYDEFLSGLQSHISDYDAWLDDNIFHNMFCEFEWLTRGRCDYADREYRKVFKNH